MKPTHQDVIDRIIITGLLGVVAIWLTFESLDTIIGINSCYGRRTGDLDAGLVGLEILLPVFFLLVMNIRWLFRRKKLASKWLRAWYMKAWVQITLLLLTALAWYFTVGVIYGHLFDRWLRCG